MIDYFRSNGVSWPRGVHLTRSTWHSCMQWGWPSIRRGEHLAAWAEYFTLSIRIGDRGWSWQWHPHQKWVRLH